MNINLILSAKNIDQDLQNIFGKIPPVLIPFSGKATIEEIYNRTSNYYDKQYLLLYENKELVIEYIKNKNINIEIIELDKISSLGYSVLYSIKYIFSQNINIDNFTISFGDTIVDKNCYEQIKDDDSFLYTKTVDCYRWTTFDDDCELKINDKKDNLDWKEYNTFIGIFNIKDVRLLFNLLNLNNKDRKMDLFYYAIKKYNDKKPFKRIITNDWIDLGHEDLYYENKKNMDTRFFNSINIDKKRGILKKVSTDKEKFAHEINWYLSLPKDLQYLTPRIFDYSLDYQNQYIKMEYYGYNTLHDIYIYGNHSSEKWRDILKDLININDEFRKFKLNLKREELNKFIDKIYYDKTLNRLEKLVKDDSFKNFFKYKNIFINGEKYENLSFYINKIKMVLVNSNIYSIKNFNIIHGDYFFANILYDIRYKIIRLVDPRGDFGGIGLYGDFRYDIAKLSHSILGDYDFIIEDLFSVEENHNEINFKIYYRDIHLRIKGIFKEIINEKYDLNDIELIESLLFLSMIPLHKDKPKRQKIMMCVGIQKLDRIMKKQIEKGVIYD